MMIFNLLLSISIFNSFLASPLPQWSSVGRAISQGARQSDEAAAAAARGSGSAGRSGAQSWNSGSYNGGAFAAQNAYQGSASAGSRIASGGFQGSASNPFARAGNLNLQSGGSSSFASGSFNLAQGGIRSAKPADFKAGGITMVGSDKFKIEKVLGNGYYGAVASARSVNNPNAGPVVVKTFFRNDAATRQNYLNEVKHLKVTGDLVKAQTYAGTMTIVQKKVPGVTVENAIRQNINNPKALKTLQERFVQGVDKFHRTGFEHGDVHPGNAMIHRGQVKMIDYGFTRSAKIGGLTHTKEINDAKKTFGKTVEKVKAENAAKAKASSQRGKGKK